MLTKIHIEMKPQQDADIPHSTGHLIYAAVLDCIQKFDSSLSKQLHQVPTANIVVTPLAGPFKYQNDKRKRVFNDRHYEFTIVFIKQEDVVSPFFTEHVLEEKPIVLGDATFTVYSLSTETVTRKALEADKVPESLQFSFNSPVSISYKDSGVTEMYPHREAIFTSLQRRWNNHVDQKMMYTSEDMKENLIEQPYKHRTHNTIITRKKHPEKLSSNHSRKASSAVNRHLPKLQHTCPENPAL